jgi:hypothetical protein
MRGRGVLIRGLAVSLAICALSASGAGTRAHLYPLNGDYADVMGGKPLLPGGGVIASTGYLFEMDGGPSLADTINPTNYSIEVVFHLKQTTSYRKLLDFKGRTVDTGLYNLSGTFDFYPRTRGTNNVFSSNVSAHIVIVRDGESGEVSGFVNGVQQWAFTDTSGDAVFSDVAGLAHFFLDDLATSKSEATGGFVDSVQVFEGALAPWEVQELFRLSAPRLYIRRSEGGAQLWWTNFVPRYRLERGLVDTGQWRAVTNVATTNGLGHFVTVETGSGGTGFFRLRRWQ